MALENYRDISNWGGTDAGFQFEFHCSNCARSWKSPFKPFRTGQLTALLANISMFVDSMRSVTNTSSKVSGLRGTGAHQAALDDALKQASRMYEVCESCHQAFCEDCYSGNDRMCIPCVKKARGGSETSHLGDASGSAAPSCPNCRTPSAGGRFCAECGFDMASTHKSCPGCGSMCERGARFCVECGHGF